MGFKLPKIKISAPKIVADPSKLITNAAEGATNLAVATTIKPATSIIGAGVGGVGEVLATPGAGELLQGVGASFGVPVPSGIGASAFTNRKADFPQESAMPQTQNFQGPSNNMIYYIVGGVVAVGAIILIIMRRK